MNPNPLLKKLGFSNEDRVVIIHADDLGMCQSTISACEQLFANKGITSAAVMVPCPWFLSAVDLTKKLSNFDLGVHITLTSEWKNYRWRPLSTVDTSSGLIDSQGFFHKTSEDVFNKADPIFVKKEIDAQINRAIAEGIDPTHIDTHMGSVAHPKFMFDYIHAGMSRRIPAMVFRLSKTEWMKIGLDETSATMIESYLADLEDKGLALIDHLRSMPLDQPENRFEIAKKIFSELPAGVTHFIIHPAEETPELKAITPDWESRVGDFRLFMDQKMRQYLKNEGIQVIGYQQIKELFPLSDIFLS
jgi:predicted glycoside hydrolase/deacetylase ChbG (UPF0249 family)